MVCFVSGLSGWVVGLLFGICFGVVFAGLFAFGLHLLLIGVDLIGVGGCLLDVCDCSI